MTINVRNFCYRDNHFSKSDVLAAVEDLFEKHTSSFKPNYVPVPDGGHDICIQLYHEVPAVFVSVKALTPAMLLAFQNCDKWEAPRVIAQLNGAVYDYAVNVVKELLVDEDVDTVQAAITIANKYRIYSMSLLPRDYRNRLNKVLSVNWSAEADVKECGKMLHDAIR